MIKVTKLLIVQVREVWAEIDVLMSRSRFGSPEMCYLLVCWTGNNTSEGLAVSIFRVEEYSNLNEEVTDLSKCDGTNLANHTAPSYEIPIMTIYFSRFSSCPSCKGWKATLSCLRYCTTDTNCWRSCSDANLNMSCKLQLRPWANLFPAWPHSIPLA
jgi:hypothetical protein